MEQYDVVIIGGGPGGYVAAIKSAQSGLRTALVEKHKLGGVCLNYGCIPTKTMLKTAKLYQEILNSDEFGIDISSKESIKVDWTKLMKRKDKVVSTLVSGVKSLLSKNKVDVYIGTGVSKPSKIIDVDGIEIGYDNLILATGSRNRIPEIRGIMKSIEDGHIIDSTGAVSLEFLPESLTILGGGVISVEFATLFASLGTKVTILQRSKELLKKLDFDVRKLIMDDLNEKGIVLKTGVSIEELEGKKVKYKEDGVFQEISSDKILLSLGRMPNVEGFENLGIDYSPKGVVTNEKMETSVKNVYAIGDMNGTFMLAHVASHEGIIAIENILGKDEKVDYDKIPNCIYSFPEVGTVGYTEDELMEKNMDYIVSKFPLTANGKALAEGEAKGFVKILADKKYGEILGVHIVAAHGTDMIAEAVASMELEGTIYELSKTVHPHPTLSEIVMEAAHGAVDKPIHIYKA
ncbi:MAG: dihydrolipoyl dehydrogenase [Firmicutes bacterium]|jgi:dihydrolipoamide dehydrogenase|nr:dihydrolipoyl dehydrogenase [Bacillota bacterium]